MVHITNKFGRAQGLQVQANQKSQGGLLDARNLNLERPNVVSKRPGERVLSLARSSTDPNDLIPGDQTRAIWGRAGETILETDRELYSLQRCGVGASGEVEQGTASPAEIAAGLAVLQTRASRTPAFDVPLPGDASAAGARQRADRPEMPDPLVITPPGRTITITITQANDSLQYTIEENATTVGPTTLPGPTPQRVARLLDLNAFAVTDDALISWIGNGTLRTLRLTPEPGDAQMSSVVTVLDPLRGAPANSWQEMRANVIAGFLSDGTLRLYTATNTASTRDFAVATPPPANGPYNLDLFTVLYPTLPVGLAWLGADDILSAVEVDPVGITITAEATAPNQFPLGARQVGVETSSIPGTAFAVAMAAQTGPLVTKPVFGLISAPPDPDLRVTDLAGDDLRLRVVVGQNGNPTTYSLRNATSGETISSVVTLLTGTSLDSNLITRDDTVFGGSVADGQIYEHLWRRSFQLTATTVLGATSPQVAVGQSTDRLLLAYLLPPFIAVRGRNDVDTAIPTNTFFLQQFPALSQADPVAIAVLSEVAATDYTARIHAFTDNGQYFSATLTSVGGFVSEVQQEAWGTIPAYTTSYPTGVPPRVLWGLETASSADELWEDDQANDLLVRVAPPIVVPAGGQWASRGPWRRTRLRSRVVRFFGRSNKVNSADAATVINSLGERCTIVGTEATVDGALADVVSTHTEAQLTIDKNGLRPRVATYDAGRAVVTYMDAAGDLQTAIWSPGSALSFGPVPATPTSADTWDITAGVYSSFPTAVTAWDRSGGGGLLDIRLAPQGLPATVYTRAHGLGVVDVAVFVEELDGVLYVAWAVAGTTVGVMGFVTGLDTVVLATQTVNAVFQRTVNVGQTPYATSVGRLSTTETAVWLETDEGINRRIRQYDVNAGSATLVRTVLRSAVVCQMARLGGGLVSGESLLADSKVQRNGLVLREHTSGEIVGRLGIGDTEDASERLLRYPHTGLNVSPKGRLVLGWQETSFDPDDDAALASVVYEWNPNVGPHNPAVLDDIAVAAHGGYPRMLDGQNVHEHDWHHLPELVSVAIVAAAGNASPGNYQIAITWEYTDALGFLYRSRPTFSATLTAVANDAFNVTYRGLTHTERTLPRAVLWRTRANGTVFYREAENLALLGTSDAQLQSLTLSDADLLAREPLDQGEGEGEILESDPVAITDFTALANGRIWSRDPRDGSQVRYTLISRAQSAPRSHVHWNLGLVVAHNGRGAVTAVAEMDARALLMSALDVSAVYGDGPDNTGGGGAYNTPAVVPVEIGAADHATLARMPEGLVYGAGPGEEPRMLARTFSNVPLAQQVPEAYLRLGQNLHVAVYVPSSGTLILADDAQPGGTSSTLRYHAETQRWAYDDLRQAKDMALLETGELFLLTTDARVLLEDGAVFSSGGSGYTSSVRTQWISLGAITQVMDQRTVQIIGSYEGSHGLTLKSYQDFSNTPVEVASISAATIDANQAAGRPYLYEYVAHGTAMAWSIEISDQGEPNQTWSIEAITFDVGSSGAEASAGELWDGHSFAKDTP